MTAPPAVEITTHSREVGIVSLRGEHDLSTWSEVAVALAAASSRPQIIVDLSACTFVDSSVMSALFVASQNLRERNGVLELVIPPQAHAIRRTFEAMRAGSILTIHETLAAGIASVERHAPDTAWVAWPHARSVDDLRRDAQAAAEARPPEAA